MQDILCYKILPYIENPFKYMGINRFIYNNINTDHLDWKSISSRDNLPNDFILKWKNKIIINYMCIDTCSRMNIPYLGYKPESEHNSSFLSSILIIDNLDTLETAILDKYERDFAWKSELVTYDFILKHIQLLTSDGLLYLFKNNKISYSFLRDNWNKIPIKERNNFLSCVDESLYMLLLKDNIIDYNILFQNCLLDESFIVSNINLIKDWNIIWKYQKLSELFIIKYQKYISNWNLIWKYQTLSENFLTLYIAKINDWEIVLYRQNITYSFYLTFQYIFDQMQQ
mgnify:CR=1 FL=1